MREEEKNSCTPGPLGSGKYQVGHGLDLWSFFFINGQMHPASPTLNNPTPPALEVPSTPFFYIVTSRLPTSLTHPTENYPKSPYF